jgi:hypothetical protein
MMRLHSYITVYYKWVFLPLWVGLFSVGTFAIFVLALFDRSASAPPLPMAFVFMTATLLGSYFIFFAFKPWRLASVWIEGDRLIVARLLTKELIPFDIVECVDEAKSYRPWQIVIRFTQAKLLGKEAVFIPKIFQYDSILLMLKRRTTVNAVPSSR